MHEKWRNHHLLLLASLTVASSAGFAQAQIEPREQTTTLISKLSEVFKSSGVATLSVGPVWESAWNTQTFYELLSNVVYSIRRRSCLAVQPLVPHLQI